MSLGRIRHSPGEDSRYRWKTQGDRSLQPDEAIVMDL